MKTLAVLVALLWTTLAQAQTCATPAQLATDLGNATQSDVISLSGVNPLNCPEIGMTQTWAGGHLVFSDSPESPTAKAKLYADLTLAATSGTNYNRVFVYHVNNSGATKRFTVVIKNTGSAAGTLTVQQGGTAGPTTSFLYAGKLAFQRWLNAIAGSGVSVAAGGYQRLDTTFDTTNVTNGNLLHGIWDYSFTQSHEVHICMLNTGDSPTSVCPGLAVAARDSHVRGTFPNADKVYDFAGTIDTTAGIQQFPLAGGTTNDTNAVGTDATDGSTQTLTGNFGIKYRMHFSVQTTDGKSFGFLFNPRGGQWGGAVKTLAGITVGGVFLVPATSGSTGDNTKGAVEGKYAPGTTPSPWCQFMPTGGSSFPLRFIAVPY
jgi:hypothetical protein